MKDQSGTNSNPGYKHGHNCRGETTPTYHSWVAMKARCTNPKNNRYERYGGRGITYCPEWETFAGFLADMKECPHGQSIDRIDNDKGYSPGNCKWSTREEQCSNKSTNVRYTFQGKTQTRSQWAREVGVSEDALANRIVNLGWSVEKALSTPVARKAARQSHFTGVTWDKKGNNWMARVYPSGKAKHLGSFQYEFDAFLAIHEFKNAEPSISFI